MRRVIIESPFAGELELNLEYARACMADAIKREEAPFASHLLYTQPGILKDDIPAEKELGIRAGLVWAEVASGVAVYEDLGVSAGMEFGIKAHEEAGRPVEYRELGGMWGQIALSRARSWHGAVVSVLAANGDRLDKDSLQKLLSLAERACIMMKRRVKAEPLRSAIFRTAAHLATRLELFKMAAEYATEGLRGEPDDGVRGELEVMTMLG